MMLRKYSKLDPILYRFFIQLKYFNSICNLHTSNGNIVYNNIYYTHSIWFCDYLQTIKSTAAQQSNWMPPKKDGIDACITATHICVYVYMFIDACITASHISAITWIKLLLVRDVVFDLMLVNRCMRDRHCFTSLNYQVLKRATCIFFSFRC